MAGKGKSAKSKIARKAPPRWSDSGLADTLDALVCDCADGVIVAMNPSGRAFLGYQGRATPVGEAFNRHVDGEWRSALARSLTSLAKGVQPKRLVLTRRDGTRMTMDIVAK